MTSFVWQGIKQRLGIAISAANWGDIVDWASRTWKRKTPSHIIAKMFLGSAVYNIWKERNARSFKLEAKTKEKLLQDICCQVSLQIRVKWNNDPHLPQFLAQWGH